MTTDRPARARRSVPSLADVRTTPRYWTVAMVLGGLAGLALATVHWAGLAVAGALVGIVAPSLRTALLAGVGIATVAWGVLLAQLAASGALSAALGMGMAFWLSAAIALGCCVGGALVRGIV